MGSSPLSCRRPATVPGLQSGGEPEIARKLTLNMRVAVPSLWIYTALQMDNDFSLDLNDIVSTIRGSDLVAMRFVSVGHRLLLDFRYTEVDGPMVKVVEPVKSIE